MSYRIVVADKDPRSRETIKRLLVSADNEFIPVATSAELNQEIKKQKPDLIILNSVLADLTDWRRVQRVIQGIKESKRYGDVPVLLVTGDPGSPSAAQLQDAGVDGYLSKPIDGSVLKGTVQSLLGIGSATVEADDGDLMIDFTDDDSGDMTEELLAMSNVALAEDEPSTEVGDTVEIDTGTLVAELDQAQDYAAEDAYEDTVRLNLEDMGLEDEIDESGSFEPTIELVADIPSEFGGSPAPVGESSVEIDLDTVDEITPDFSTASDGYARPVEAKDSVTVEMDMDELQLDVEEEPLDSGVSSGAVDRIDPYDTEIGKLLGVEEPSEVYTSEELMIEEDSVGTDASMDATTEPGMDVIDLEDDTEIRDIEMEELEAVRTGEEEGFAFDDETVPVETEEMDQIAKENLGEIDLDLAEESPIEAPLDADHPSLELGPMYGEETPSEELTLEEAEEDEFSTQEFFGEELPTEEFPTEKYPEDKTRDLAGMQEISLEEDVSFESGEGELALEAPSPDEILLEEGREEEPMLEVTEDISFDEITLDSQAEERIVGGLEEFELAPPSAVVEPATEREAPSAPPLPEPPEAPPVAPVQSAAAAGIPMMPVGPEFAAAVSSILGDRLKDVMPGKAEFADSMGTALKDSIPEKGDFSHAFSETVKSSLPSKDEIIEGVLRGLAGSLPTRDEIFERVDKMVRESLPSTDYIEERVDQAVKAALPAQEVILERVDRALDSFTGQEDLGKRLEEALSKLPSADMMLTRFEDALKAIPSDEDINTRLDEALGKFPSAETIAARVESVVADAVRANELSTRVEAMLGGMPSAEDIQKRVDEAFKALPTREDLIDRVDVALQSIPSHDDVAARLDDAFRGFPSAEEVNRRFDDAIAALPAPEAVTSRIDEALAAIPSQKAVRESIDASLSKAIPPEMVADRLDVALRGLPSPDYIRLRLESAFAALPTPDIVNQRIDMALRAIPAAQEVEARLDRALSAIPSAETIAKRIDTALAAIPSETDILTRVDEGLKSLPGPDDLVSRVDDYIQRLMPPSEEIRSAFHKMLIEKIDSAVSQQELRATVLSVLPQTETLVETMRQALPDRDRLKDALTASLADAVRNSLPERVWLESVSRGLFDERTKGVLPGREEVIAVLREEVRSQLLTTIEKLIREQIEKVTAGISE
ncbi:MAG: response regulator [Desulfomonile tiedjei]|nr:response regulator [Desulfomonile tiedjei]